MNVVLLHAWPLDERMWKQQQEALAVGSRRVLTPRLYGRGRSIEGWA